MSRRDSELILGELLASDLFRELSFRFVLRHMNNIAESGSDVEVGPIQDCSTIQDGADKIEAERTKVPDDNVAEIQNVDDGVRVPTDKFPGQYAASGGSLKDELNDEPLVSCSTDDNDLEPVLGSGEPNAPTSKEVMEPLAEEPFSSKETEVKTKDFGGIVETDKDLHVDVMKLESESGIESAEGIECVASSNEGDQSANKDSEEEPSNDQAQAVEFIQAPPGKENNVIKRHHVYMIKVPRFTDEELQEKIQHAWEIVEKKTQIRNAIDIKTQLAVVNKYSLDYKGELAKERAARFVFNAKRKDVEIAQELIGEINTANSIADIDAKIRDMVHRQQHETVSLKQEKNYIQDINQMKRQREQLSLKKTPREQIDEKLNQKHVIEEHFKNLKIESDSLRAALSSAERSAQAAWYKYMEEEQKLKGLREEHNAADAARQEAYLHWKNLRKELAEKARHFRKYKADRSAATNYIFAGDNQGLRSHCSRQVERIMDLWNNIAEFREQYVKFNIYSTVRRLGTSDGRSLGPGEEAPVLRSQVDTSSKIFSAPSSNTETPAPVLLSEVIKEEKVTEPSAVKRVARKNQSTTELKSSTKPALAEDRVLTDSNSEEPKEEEKENEQKREEEELARKAEELARQEEELNATAKEEEMRKEKAAAELREQMRLDQKAKAKEAEERKRRKAEKAQAKAQYKAQKKAELKEKKKANKEKKTGMVDTTSGDTDGDSTPPIPDSNSSVTSQELEPFSSVSSRKKSARPASLTRQYNKVQPPVPSPLRNRGKKKMATWMWALLGVLLVLVLFFIGNYISLPASWLSHFSF